MVHHGNRGKRAGKRNVRKSGSIYLKLVDGSVCRNVLAESAKMGRNYVIHRTDDVNSLKLRDLNAFGYKDST